MKTRIKIDNRKDYEKVMEKLTKEGCKWSFNDTPNRFTPTEFKTRGKVSIFVDENKKITWGTYECVHSECKVFTAAEYLADNKEVIVIYRKGNETIALNKRTGEKAVAKCSPDDTYDFNTGAKLAFARLTDTEVKEVRRIANVNEYIKITYVGLNEHIGYEKGDIIKVTVKRDSGGVKGRNTRTGGNTGAICSWEYVVLEGYKPPQEEKPKYYSGKVVCIEGVANCTTKGKIYEVKDGVITFDTGWSINTKAASFEMFNKVSESTYIELVE